MTISYQAKQDLENDDMRPSSPARSLFIRLSNKIIRPLKWVAPHQFTKLTRILIGLNDDLDKMVGMNLPTIADMAKDKQNKLFVDCGVNEGFVLNRYMSSFEGFDFVGFEIQEELVPLARQSNPGAEIINKAVSDKNGTIDIYLPKSYGPNFRGGASIEPNKIRDDNLHSKKEIEAIDFVEFLKGKTNTEDYDFIAVKMDIEGAEYRIIDALYRDYLETGVTLIDYLMIEYHPAVLPSPEMQTDYVKKLNDMKIVVSHWV